MGDGFKIRFGHDLWCGDVTLKETFLVLFCIVRAKDASIAALLEFYGGSI